MPDRPHKVPWLTLSLIGVNLAVAFWLLFDPAQINALAFRPGQSPPWTAFTSLFAHVNIVHLLGNLVFLAAVGPIVEFAKGPLRFALVYFVSGLVGLAGFWLFASATGSAQSVVGASAAIAGCVAFCAVRFGRTKVPVFVNLAIPVAVLVALWVVLQAVGAIVRVGDVLAADTGYWPHLAGFLAGLVLAALLGANTDAKQEFGHAVLDRMNDRGPAAALAAADLHLKNHPEDPKALQQKAEAEIALAETDAAARTLQNLYSILDEPARIPVLQTLADIARLQVLPVTTRLRTAETIADQNPRLAEKLYRSVAEDPQESRRPEALLALVELNRDENPQEAQHLARLLADQYALHPATETARNRGLLE